RGTLRSLYSARASKAYRTGLSVGRTRTPALPGGETQRIRAVLPEPTRQASLGPSMRASVLASVCTLAPMVSSRRPPEKFLTLHVQEQLQCVWLHGRRHYAIHRHADIRWAIQPGGVAERHSWRGAQRVN